MHWSSEFDAPAGQKTLNIREIFIRKIPVGCHLDEIFKDCWSIVSKISHTWGKCLTCFEVLNSSSPTVVISIINLRTFLRQRHFLSFQPMKPGLISIWGWVYVGCMFHPVQQVHITSLSWSLDVL